MSILSGDARESGALRLANAWLRRLPWTPGGFAENLLLSWVEAPSSDLAPERTALCQLRLAYTFLHAAGLGCGGAAAAGRSALDGANEVFWREELRGWTRSADVEGFSLDAAVDTYDQAFGLLALAWDYRTSEGGSRGVVAPKRRALEALAGLDEDAAAASGGYLEFRNGGSPSALVVFPGHRRQNPHMHLLEAFLAWWKVDGDGPWAGRAAAMVDLLRTRFLDPAEGFLREYFDDALRPVPGLAGSSLEPGHHFEWVWLLNEYRKLSGDETVAESAKALYEFGVKKGLDADGLAFDVVDLSGSIVEGGKLLWPQTEQLKAHLAIHEWTGDEGALAAAKRTLRLISTLYCGEGDGRFVNGLDRDRRPVPGPMRARLLYHIFLALVEAERVMGYDAAIDGVGAGAGHGR